MPDVPVPDVPVPEVSGRGEQVAQALAAVRERIAAACQAAHRRPAEVALLPVTKFFPASDVLALYQLGLRDFGESRDQEAVGKVTAVARDDIRWHMVGRLQRNKAKSVARWAHTVLSVDSQSLASALDAAACRALSDGLRPGPLRVLLQVSLDRDPRRGGVLPEALLALAEVVAGADCLELAGLMAVPPRAVDPDPHFAALARLHQAVLAQYPAATQLSAGMSADLEVAISHGCTCVRVGTALLGDRSIPSG